MLIKALSTQTLNQVIHRKNTSSGFTLVELIVVIVILGILSATALPKFIDLKHDAVLAKLQSMQAGVKSASNLVYAQAYLDGKTTGTQWMWYGTSNMQVRGGYPSSSWNNGLKHAINKSHLNWTPLTTVCAEEWCAVGGQVSLPSGVPVVSGAAVKLAPEGYRLDQQCGVYYINYLDGSSPDIGIESADC